MAAVTQSELDTIVREVNFHVDPEATGTKQKLVTYLELKTFFDREKQFWNQNNYGRLSIFSDLFNGIASEIQRAGQLDQRNARDTLARVFNTLQSQSSKAIFSTTPNAQFLVSIDKKNTQQLDGAVDYLIDEVRFQHFPTKQYFNGSLSAALFQQTDLSDHFLGVDRTGFDSLRREVTEFRNALESENQRIINDLNNWRANSESEIRTLTNGSQTRFDNFHTKWESAIDNFHGESKERLKSLEELYREKLRLDAPAKYWSDLRDSYKTAGGWWTFASFLLSLAAIGGIGLLLYHPPDVFLRTEVTPGTIKAAILIAVALSIVGYLVTLFVRMATSSIHLSRDARERLQLTHMFLSLVKEQALEPKDRDIVLAALFSRADTGLLKHDGTPAMASPVAQLLDALKSR